MTALDTNLLVRLVTADDARQTELARQFLKSNRCWLAKTVLLELEWVLRFTYELGRERIAWAVRGFLSNRQIELEDRPAVLRALRWYEAGLDFADALHLASAGPATRFATFDRPLSKAASALPEAPGTVLLR